MQEVPHHVLFQFTLHPNGCLCRRDFPLATFLATTSVPPDGTVPAWPVLELRAGTADSPRSAPRAVTGPDSALPGAGAICDGQLPKLNSYSGDPAGLGTSPSAARRGLEPVPSKHETIKMRMASRTAAGAADSGDTLALGLGKLLIVFVLVYVAVLASVWVGRRAAALAGVPACSDLPAECRAATVMLCL